MRTMLLTVAALAAILLVAGCGGNPPPTFVTSDTQNRIALCTGGYSASARREIAAEISRRDGTLISEAETQERGVDTFAFGEHQGDTAVKMYNAYVECIRADVGSREGVPAEPRRRYHEVGIIPTGESVVQVPVPGQEKVGEEIQLQIVIHGDSWRSNGTPRWEGRCSDGFLRQIGNSTSYVYRFLTQSNYGSSCTIALHAMASRDSYYWRQEYHVQIRAQ